MTITGRDVERYFSAVRDDPGKAPFRLGTFSGSTPDEAMEDLKRRRPTDWASKRVRLEEIRESGRG